VGASKYEPAKSVHECLDYCGSQSNCVAVDVDLTQQPPTCWPHFSADDLLDRNVYSQPGTNQYRLKERCVNNTAGIRQQLCPPPPKWRALSKAAVRVSLRLSVSLSVSPVPCPWLKTVRFRAVVTESRTHRSAWPCGHVATRNGQKDLEIEKLRSSTYRKPTEIEPWLLLNANRKS